MNEWYERAAEKLEREKKAGKYDQYAAAMKNDVCDALNCFCGQDSEFAQAVVQGGSFEDCMKAVARNCGNAISDLKAYQRAVQFYFPGAEVRFHMTVDLCGSVETDMQKENTQPIRSESKILNLDDFL